jgi:hypothetical protein
MRRRKPNLQRGLIFVGPVPPPRSLDIGELDDDQPLRYRSAIEQLELVAAGDDPPAVASNSRQGNRHMSPEGYRVGYVYISDDIGGHSIPPSQG